MPIGNLEVPEEEKNICTEELPTCEESCPLETEVSDSGVRIGDLIVPENYSN